LLGIGDRVSAQGLGALGGGGDGGHHGFHVLLGIGVDVVQRGERLLDGVLEQLAAGGGVLLCLALQRFIGGGQWTSPSCRSLGAGGPEPRQCPIAIGGVKKNCAAH